MDKPWSGLVSRSERLTGKLTLTLLGGLTLQDVKLSLQWYCVLVAQAQAQHDVCPFCRTFTVTYWTDWQRSTCTMLESAMYITMELPCWCSKLITEERLIGLVVRLARYIYVQESRQVNPACWQLSVAASRPCCSWSPSQQNQNTKEEIICQRVPALNAAW